MVLVPLFPSTRDAFAVTDQTPFPLAATLPTMASNSAKLATIENMARPMRDL
jgi:hypothetical protein